MDILCPHCGEIINIKGLAPDKKPKPIVMPYFETWNTFAKEAGLPGCRETNTIVLKSLNARIKEKGFPEDFRDALEYIRGNSFYRGLNDTHWKANLEYLCRPSKAEELAAKYRVEKENGHPKPQGPSGSPDRLLSGTGPE
jgi:hypothetical protein